MGNNGEASMVSPSDLVPCKTQEQINLFRLAVDDSVQNAERCLSSASIRAASLQIVEKELSAQIDSLIKCWEQLKICISKDQEQLSIFGREFRNARRRSQITLQEVSGHISGQHNTPTNTSTTVVNSTLPAPKLPTLKIPNFDGNLANWSSFWDIYDSLIHSRTDLTDVVKFATLNYLSDRALKSVEGLAVTNSITIKTKTLFTNQISF